MAYFHRRFSSSPARCKQRRQKTQLNQPGSRSNSAGPRPSDDRLSQSASPPDWGKFQPHTRPESLALGEPSLYFPTKL